MRRRRARPEAGSVASYYYRIEYYNIEDWVPVLLEFTVIDVDDYLDMMVDKKLIIE